jgi:transcriptional regulator with PAS, ATPase and Fis domain
MSKTTDNWQYFLSRVEDGLGGYEPDYLIAEVIKAILKNRYEGMIVVDTQGHVAFMDKPTEKLFGLSPGRAKGRPFAEFFKDLGLLEVLKTGAPQIGQIQEIGGQKKIVTRFPIIKDGQIIGAVGKVVFHELEEIKELSAKIRELEARISKYKEDLMAINRASYTFDNILGGSKSITKAKEMARRIASTDSTILLVGESGTGKELFAHSIHQASARSNGPFVRVNCPSIPFDLAESELFGYEKGAFTGASKVGQKGKFEVASGGTIFLDEISSMPLTIQAKLLRVIQEKEIQPLGSTETKKVDFRLVAATNVDLSDLIRKGSFRADLYYRLSSVPVHIPPLRKRREDIPLIVNTLLPSINQKLNAAVHSITPEALAQLVSYDWPGNIRELFNVMEQGILNSYPATEISPKSLPEFLRNTVSSHMIRDIGISSTVAEAERKAIVQTLEATKGNKRKASQMLGISRQGLYQKMRRLNIK